MNRLYLILTTIALLAFGNIGQAAGEGFDPTDEPKPLFHFEAQKEYKPLLPFEIPEIPKIPVRLNSGNDFFVTGHVTPLPSEMLTIPIKLKCGITIYEWRGATPDIKKANAYCDLAKQNFLPFMAKYNYHPKHNRPFDFRMALMKPTKSYRNLNDTAYRFANRKSLGNLWGYTDQDHHYTFVLSDHNHPQFKVTFVHELFHSLSMHYGFFDAHANTRWKREQKDEYFAQEFTMSLGLGR